MIYIYIHVGFGSGRVLKSEPDSNSDAKRSCIIIFTTYRSASRARKNRLVASWVRLHFRLKVQLSKVVQACHTISKEIHDLSFEIM